MKPNQWALITGASSGIGLELAAIAASKGYNLILVARNESRLNELKHEWETQFPIRVLVLNCDLSLPDANIAISKKLQEEAIVPVILINNAGFGLFGAFNETDIQRETDMIQVNIMALTQLTKAVYTQMAKQGSGKILNIASVAGFMPGPLMAVYYATKAYVLSFSQALANEAKGTGVTVSVLCPGPTESNFLTNAALESSMLFKNFGKLPSAREVAEFGFRNMMKGKTVLIHGAINRLMVYFTRLVPRNMLASMVRYVQRKS